ncbi:MAG: DUF1549 domain-containing protein, partial [Pirellulales bacterium]
MDTIKIVLTLSLGLGTLMAAANAAEQKPIDFNQDIRPLLTDRCFHCHGPDVKQVKGDLRLDLEDSAKDFAIAPGDVTGSDLITRISSTDPDEQMPPADAGKPALTAEEVALFKRWIEEGAVWANHWAWEAPTATSIPTVDKVHTVYNPIDNFIIARLNAEGLSPASVAGRATLIRRAAFDITGLPPTLEEIDRFEKDTDPNAYSSMLDRLFNSKHYGERMAIDWLDGARYADSNGFQNDFGRDMYPWRDWVIDSFNANMPFDQFTIEQIAGDLLPGATRLQRVATGFHRNHRSNTEGGVIEEEWRTENIIDRVVTTGAVFLGLTLGCARCHDHKYDPFTQKEFYQFYSFFNHTKERGVYIETRGNAGVLLSLPSTELEAKITQLEADITAAEMAFKPIKQSILKRYEQATAPLDDPDTTSDEKADFHLPLNGNNPLSISEGANISWQDGLLGKALHLQGKTESSFMVKRLHLFEHDQPFSVTWWVRMDFSGPFFQQRTPDGSLRGLHVSTTATREVIVTFAHQQADNLIQIQSTENFP